MREQLLSLATPTLSEKAVVEYYARFRNVEDIRNPEHFKLSHYFETPTG